MSFLNGSRELDGGLVPSLPIQGRVGWEEDLLADLGGGATRRDVTRQVCCNPECSSHWTMPWRNRKRPTLEGEWGCSSRCVLALVQAAVRRERGDGVQRPIEPHRHRIPLGLVMLAQGWITHPQLRQALDAHRAQGEGRIGEWLVAECGVEPERVMQALGVQWSCPVFELGGFAPGKMGVVMPKRLAGEFGVVPLRVRGANTLQLGFGDGPDASAAFAVGKMSELKIQSGLLDRAQFQEAKERLLASEAVAASMEEVSGVDALAARIAAMLEQKQPLASRLVRVHQYYWLRMWLESGTKGNHGRIPRSAEDMWDYVFSLGASA